MFKLCAIIVIASLCFYTPAETQDTNITIIVNGDTVVVTIPVSFVEVFTEVADTIVANSATTTIDIDECSSDVTNKCNENETCVNLSGDFKCPCIKGFLREAEDVECVTDLCFEDGIFCNATGLQCNNDPNDLKCDCGFGFHHNGTECTIETPCFPNNCPNNSLCVASNATHFDCNCRDGFTGNNCEDIDECMDGSAGCDNSIRAECENTDGGFTCSCKMGYSGDGTTCVDINECSVGTNDCSPNADCFNTNGSFICSCQTGYTGGGRTCTDVDECDVETHNCGTRAFCDNTLGSFDCTCNDGFSGDGRTCVDIDECAEGLHDCDNLTRANCMNNLGSYSCSCKDGYSGIGRSCTNIDECAEGLHDCDNLTRANCMDSLGSYSCSCKDGYSGNGQSCMNIIECDEGTDNCDHNSRANCVDNEGSFVCECREGYNGNGVNCTDIDECAEPEGNNCAAEGSDCTNEPGTFRCSCQDGFNGNGKICSSESSSIVATVVVTQSRRRRATSVEDNFEADLENLLRVLLSDNTINVTVLNFSESGGETTYSILIVTPPELISALENSLKSIQGSLQIAKILYPIPESFTGTLTASDNATTACNNIEDFILNSLATESITGDTRVECNGTKVGDTLDFTVTVEEANAGTFSIADILQGYTLDVNVTNLCDADTCSPDGFCDGTSGSAVCACPANEHDLNLSDPGKTCGSPIHEIDCGTTVTVRVYASYFVSRGISVDTLHFADTNCTDTGENPIFLTLSSGHEVCGWKMDNLPDEIVYYNFVTNIRNGVAVFNPSVEFPVNCSYEREFSTDNGEDDQPPSIAVESLTTLVHFGSDDGDLTVRIAVYEDENFTVLLTTDTTVNVGDPLYLLADLTIGSGFLRLLEVYITPTNNPEDSETFDLVTNSCPAETAVEIISSGVSTTASLKIEARKFRDSDEFFVHSRVRVCETMCQPNCPAIPTRRRRDTDSESSVVGPILVKERSSGVLAPGSDLDQQVPDDVPPSASNPAGFVALGIVAAVLLVVCVVLVATKLRKRQPESNSFLSN